MPRIFIFTSISGMTIDKSLEEISSYANEKNVTCSFFRFEDYLVLEAERILFLMGEPKNEGNKYSLAQVLTLPYSQLSDACTHAFDRLFADIAELRDSVNAVLISLHPIYFHQQTLEYTSPLITSKMSQVIQKYNLMVDYIISIHDDIYDYYRKLIQKGQLLHPKSKQSDLKEGKRERDPNKDINDLLFILSWRDRELTSSINKAKALDVKHLLFHNKGRISALWKIIWDSSPHVYFSHPISQPRHDINGKPNKGKSESGNKDRGERLIKDIQQTADELSRKVPLIEPTSIDEYRINFDKLESIKISMLQNKIIPPLTKRWPFGHDNRLGDKHENESNELLLEIENDIYPHEEFEFSDKNILSYESALKVLEEEIKRQINVRDHVLAYQADRIVAFRPFSHPDSPEPAGGVLEEIYSLIRQIKLGVSNTKSALVIVHPNEDEKDRRKNELNQAWNDKFEKYLRGDAVKKNELKNLILLEITNLDNTPENIKAKIINFLKNEKIELLITFTDTSMPTTQYLKEENERRKFADQLIEKTTLMKSILESESERYSEQIVFIKSYHSTKDLCRQILDLMNK